MKNHKTKKKTLFLWPLFYTCVIHNLQHTCNILYLHMCKHNAYDFVFCFKYANMVITGKIKKNNEFYGEFFLNNDMKKKLFMF